MYMFNDNNNLDNEVYIYTLEIIYIYYYSNTLVLS